MSSEKLVKLQEFIKENPASLNHDDRRERRHERCDRRERRDHDDDYFHREDESDKEDEYDDEDVSEDDKEEFVSKKEIEIGKLEEQIRYLKLDLNNEQLKSHSLTETLHKRDIQVAIQSQTIRFICDMISFTSYKIDESANMVDITKRFVDFQSTYQHLLSHEPFDDEYDKNMDDYKHKKYVNRVIYAYYLPTLNQKYTEIKTSYEQLIQSMKMANQTMLYMKIAIVILFVTNLLALRKILF
jgi:uncharacterized coiled-coil protein SlyX